MDLIVHLLIAGAAGVVGGAGIALAMKLRLTGHSRWSLFLALTTLAILLAGGMKAGFTTLDFGTLVASLVILILSSELTARLLKRMLPIGNSPGEAVKQSAGQDQTEIYYLGSFNDFIEQAEAIHFIAEMHGFKGIHCSQGTYSNGPSFCFHLNLEGSSGDLSGFIKEVSRVLSGVSELCLCKTSPPT